MRREIATCFLGPKRLAMELPMDPSSLRSLRPSDIREGPSRPLEGSELEGLWKILEAINENWRLFWDETDHPPDHSLFRIRSSWREFVRLRADPPGPTPEVSYIAEYENAIRVVEELRRADSDCVWKVLFSVDTGGAVAPPGDADVSSADLLHAKTFVLNEFMTVLMVSGGFKHFGGRNTNGYMAGSRTSRTVSISAPFSYPERTS